jgi:TetR/AcrR family transcriptional regulator
MQAAEPLERTETAPKSRILDAASRAFADKGFEGARVDEIAREAGVNKAMLYYHVGDKAALYEAVLARNFDLLSTNLKAALAEPGDEEARLKRAVGVLFQTLRRIPDHPKLMMREIAGGASNLSPMIMGQLAGIFGTVRSLIEEGRRSGALRDVDPLIAHVVIVGSVVFTLSSGPLREIFRANTPGFVPADAGDADLAGTIGDMLWKGIRADGEAGIRRTEERS